MQEITQEKLDAMATEAMRRALALRRLFGTSLAKQTTPEGLVDCLTDMLAYASASSGLVATFLVASGMDKTQAADMLRELIGRIVDENVLSFTNFVASREKDAGT